jgi:hypothetical protein
MYSNGARSNSEWEWRIHIVEWSGEMSIDAY